MQTKTTAHVKKPVDIMEIERMCGNSQSPSGTRSKLHAPDDQ